MTDIETLLESDAAQWQREVDAAAAPGSYSPPAGAVTSRRPRLRTTIFAVAAVAIIVAGAGLVTHLRTDRAARPALTSRTYNGLTLTFPADWRVLTPTFLNAGVDYPIAYLTNAHVSDQCPGGSCQGPVNEVDAGQVYVAVNYEPFVRTDYRLTDNVAGQPARIRAGTIPPGECPERTQQYMFADIALRGPQDGLAIHACIGANGSTPAAQVRQMIKTARYQ